MKALSFSAVGGALALAFPMWVSASPNGNPTIDVMTTGTIFGYTQNYVPGNTFQVGPIAISYLLSDGSSWPMGAGVFSTLWSNVDHVALVGGKLEYDFKLPDNGILFSNTDYSFGDHSAQGVLGVPSELVLIADFGAKTGTIEGYTKILSNDPTYYPSFNYYSAPVGASVWFETTVTLQGDARFLPRLFNTSFSYNESGEVDFTRLQPVPEPTSVALMLGGLCAVGTLVGRRRSSR